MRTFNKEKTEEIFSPNLEKGYLQKDKLLVQHHDALPKKIIKTVSEQVSEYEAQGKEVTLGDNGQNYYVTVKFFQKTGEMAEDGREVELIEPIIEEAKEAWDEYEDIQVYIPYSDEENAKREIAKLKQNLFDTDYKAIKYAEGYLTEEEYTPIKLQRQAWRDEINALEEKLI